MTQPVVSICIPTYGRVEILRKTLDSIFAQNVDSTLYEICISDNSPTDETKEMLNAYYSDRSNICYAKSTCEGYYNSIESLKLGKGKLLKLHNNYSKFKNNTFEKFVKRIADYENTKPVMFYSFGAVKLDQECTDFASFDFFLNAISYYSTWSTSFGIWKDDFDEIMKAPAEPDKMFPHTSLLFALCDKSEYVVDNALYFENQDVGKKGGYNLPQTFGTRYLGMCESLLCKNKITEQTLEKIKAGILQFIADWYVNVLYFSNKYTFSYENWEAIVTDLYGISGVDFIKRNARKKKIKSLLRKVLKKY